MPSVNSKSPLSSSSSTPTVVGLFAGIGGIERGLHRAGFHTELLCEIAPEAEAVLRSNFADAPFHDDVRTVKRLPKVDVLAAGFPCQDLSQAGRTAGISGNESGLVGEVFRLLGSKRSRNGPKWLLLENVPFMLQLDKGRAMHYLIEELEDRGYNWAYRIVDSNAFGLPQRRRRVLLLASRTEDPRGILLNPEAGETAPDGGDEVGCGFYWTEGTRGLGWAVDAIPTLKGGSTVGIPSPPAIWNPKDHSIVTPDLRDAERLQGFPVDWTLAAVPPERKHRQGPRWRLVGNAVSVPVAEWVGRRLQKLEAYVDDGHVRIAEGDRWPSAAWGRSGEAYRCERSCWPVRRRAPHLLDFLRFKPKDLSIKATAGFLGRLRNSTLRRSRAFERDLERHLARMVRRAAA